MANNNNNLDAIIGLGAVIGGLAAIAAIADETKPTKSTTSTTRREPKPEYYIAKPSSTGNRGTWNETTPRPVSQTQSKSVEDMLKDWLFTNASRSCRENGGVAVAIIRRLAHDGWKVIEDVRKDSFTFKVKVRHYSMAHDLIIRIDTTEVKLLADYFTVIKITRYGGVDYSNIYAFSDKENGYYEQLARDIQAYLG